MKMLYCVYDLLAREASFLLEQPNDECAIRALRHPVLSNSQVDPNELQLYQIGVFDSSEPRIVDMVPRLVGNLGALLTAPNPAAAEHDKE
ncbi:nonstructural protein [Peromfec virus RodF8_66]|uniref:Nonstructural protein n=1 Tax=Peromfec virus RodF8_66 TaxID=2929388 RepID=A0A976N1X2_9VIRU|nr:nonstructural protein [Peromfec virus RodF8_66]